MLNAKQKREIKMSHHQYGPSAAHRYIACPASVKLSADIPDQPNKYSEAGTQAHGIAEAALSANLPVKSFLTHEAEAAFNDIGLDVNDALDHIESYVDYVKLTAQGRRIYIEQRVSLSPYVPGGFGTCDAIILINDHLHIIDFKFGTSWVKVTNNEQLGLYALGALTMLRKAGRDIKKVTLHVHQPRAGNVKAWDTTPEWLIELGEKANRAIKLAEGPNPPFSPSPKACEWCKAKAICPALHEQALATVGNDFDVLPAVQTLPKEKAAHVLQHHKLITSWLDELKTHWVEQINNGDELPGFTVQKRQGAREWTDDAKEVLHELIGDEATETKLIGVTKAAKLVPNLDQLGIIKRKKDSYMLKEVKS